MEDQGVAHFNNVEEFKRAFLPTHQACRDAEKVLAVSEEKIKLNAAIVEDIYEKLHSCMDDIYDYFSKHRTTLDSPLAKVIHNESPSTELVKERDAAKAFSYLLLESKKLLDLKNKITIDKNISDQLEKAHKKLFQDWQNILHILSQVRQEEDKYVARCKVLGDEKRAEEKRNIEAQLKLDAEKLVIAERRKSLKKKTLWTVFFIVVLVGFIKNQMAMS